MKKKVIYIIVIAAVVIAGVLIIVKPFGKDKQKIELATDKVIKGNISNKVSATGRLETLEAVEVGTQVSGIIDEILVDYNSKVKKGDILALIDKTTLLASLEQTQSSVDNAQVELDFQKANYERNKVLMEKNLIAQSDFDQVEYNYKRAVNSLKNAESQHERNKINLDYATIYSPIDGVVLERAVERGQTVQASFNTPTLFTIANDLTKMQVEVSVDEADIGKLREGQRVEFKVDAYPQDQFTGEISQIRYQPVETSSVITYTVVVDAENPEEKLMPGMTANVDFFVLEKNNVLLVPAEATYFTAMLATLDEFQKQNPDIVVEKPSMPGSSSQGASSAQGDTPADRPAQGQRPAGQMPQGAMAFNAQGGMPGGPMSGGMGFGGNQSQSSNTQVKLLWVKEGNTIKQKPVVIGDTDELYYEVISGLKEGDEVITSLGAEQTFDMSSSPAARSAFMMGGPMGRR